jgi:hypothetical protein
MSRSVPDARGGHINDSKTYKQVRQQVFNRKRRYARADLEFAQYDRSLPCLSCPWRRSSTVGGADIPGFQLELMEGLANTVGADDAFRPIMACHYSEEGAEFPCVGYLAREGWSNLAVRVLSLQGRVDLPAIEDRCAGLDLWPDFHTMLAAYREAVESQNRRH